MEHEPDSHRRHVHVNILFVGYIAPSIDGTPVAVSLPLHDNAENKSLYGAM